MKEKLFTLIQEVGKAILKVKDRASISEKLDTSPFTQADKISHDELTKGLATIRNIPILSEEVIIPYSTRREWKEFWLIDPLDGTKDFTKGFNDFCINIALIQEGYPVLGLIYAPQLEELYWAEKGKGFEYHGPKRLTPPRTYCIAATSRFHHSEKTQRFMAINHVNHLEIVGASLKFGRMALGEIDLYPRFEGSCEWDTAAGQIILEEAECHIIDLHTQEKPQYNKKNLKNNYFIALSSKINFTELRYEELK